MKHEAQPILKQTFVLRVATRVETLLSLQSSVLVLANDKAMTHNRSNSGSNHSAKSVSLR